MAGSASSRLFIDLFVENRRQPTLIGEPSPRPMGRGPVGLAARAGGKFRFSLVAFLLASGSAAIVAVGNTLDSFSARAQTADIRFLLF
jgi:hypothetical protein